MRVLGRQLPTPALMWLGLLAPPLAWTGQLVFGFGLTEAACGRAGSRWDIPVDTWTAAATAVAGALALLGGLAAVSVFRETRSARGEGGAEEPPPLGRVHFLATVGLAIAPLFLFMIVMSGVGVVDLPDCQQS